MKQRSPSRQVPLAARRLEAVGATLFGGVGGGGVPAACLFLVLGWLDTPQYLALVAGSLAAYGFALFIAERADRVLPMPPASRRVEAPSRVSWPDDWLRS